MTGAVEAPNDRPIVCVVRGEVRFLSVTDVMENGGEVCGSQWGWLTLGEICEYGAGIDTDGEVWRSDQPDLVAEQMRQYWKAYPCLKAQEEENYGADGAEVDCTRHEHSNGYYPEPPGLILGME